MVEIEIWYQLPRDIKVDVINLLLSRIPVMWGVGWRVWRCAKVFGLSSGTALVAVTGHELRSVVLLQTTWYCTLYTLYRAVRAQCTMYTRELRMSRFYLA